jgi:hypothetical protein
MFVGNGSVSKSPQQWIDEQQQRYCWKWGDSMWSVSRSYLEDNWGDQLSSVRESVRIRGSWNRGAIQRGLVCVKLKNLHCLKPLQGKDGEDTAGWKRLSGYWGDLWIVENGGGAINACISETSAYVVNKSKSPARVTHILRDNMFISCTLRKEDKMRGLWLKILAFMCPVASP